MKKWIKRILLIILALIIIVGIYQYWRLVYNIQLNGNKLNEANSALAEGITISDSKDDFVMLGSNKEELNAEDNPSPYRLEEVDIKSMQISADNNNLYFKINFYSASTKKPPVVDGDKIDSVGIIIDIFNSQNKELAVLHADFGWLPVIGTSVTNTYYSTGPTGIIWPESARYTTENRDSKVTGGTGTDYLLAAFPLRGLELKFGETINLDMSMEVGSQKFTHAAVDVLAGLGKTPARVKWQIGSQNYEVFEDQIKDQNK